MSLHRPSADNEITVTELGSLPQPVGHLGGRTRRKAPTAGLRPTVRFAVALALTLAWVGFSVWVSDPWRDELGDAIGPVMAWVIPIFLAYIPGLVIGFMIATLLITGTRNSRWSLREATGPKASGRL